MGNKLLKINERQLKMLVENTVMEAVPAQSNTDNVSNVTKGIIKAAEGPGTNAKNLINFIKLIPNQSELDKINALFTQNIEQNKRGGFPYEDLVAVLNGELEDDNNYAALEIINHAFSKKLNITAEPIKVTKYQNVDPNLFYPKAGTWKVGPAFNSATGEASKSSSDKVVDSSKKPASTPDPKVVEIQKELINKGYKLPGKRGGADGILGRWTKIAQDIDKKDPQNGAATFNAQLDAARKKAGTSAEQPAQTSSGGATLDNIMTNPKVSSDIKVDLETLRKKLRAIGVDV